MIALNPRMDGQPNSAAIECAAHWIASTEWEQRPKPLVPYLKLKFGLSAKEAVLAIGKSQRMRNPDKADD